MKSPYEQQLRDKSENLVRELKTEGVEAAIEEDSFREFHVKISISKSGIQGGKVALYYKPSKKLFTLQLGELRRADWTELIDKCWQKVIGAFLPMQNVRVSPMKDTNPKLTEKAKAIIPRLESALNVKLELDEKTFSDYGVKLVVIYRGQFCGHLGLFYSAKKETFSITVYEIKDKELSEQIKSIWTQWQVDDAKSSITSTAKTSYQAFVDGSFDSEKNTVGYGAVILKDGEEIQRIFGGVDKYTDAQQIGGELSATMRVISWCKQQNVKEIDIFYDYVGIENWATGKFKLEGEMQEGYAKYIKNSGIKIYWHKVASHTGNYWNDVADELAKQGASQRS
jgi:ribonuclease H-related protein